MLEPNAKYIYTLLLYYIIFAFKLFFNGNGSSPIHVVTGGDNIERDRLSAAINSLDVFLPLRVYEKIQTIESTNGRS